MSDFRCSALIDGHRHCAGRCWGRTAFCVWHNCFLGWRWWALCGMPLRRSAAWVFYDPTLITEWSPPRSAPTPSVMGATFFAPALVALLALTGVIPGDWRLFWIAVALWWSASIPPRVMVSGNSHPLLPKLLLGVAVVLVGLHFYRWYQAPDAGWGARYLVELVGAMGVLLWALPPLPGPLVNAGSDLTDAQQLPPMNMGVAAVSILGWLCFGVFVVGLVVVPLIVPVAPDVAPPTAAEVTPSVDGTPPSPAETTSPDPGWMAFLDNLWIVGPIVLVVSLMFGNFGSFSSIRAEWHAQTIYHRCVMPNVMKVTAMPQTAGFLAGLGTYWLLARLLLLGVVPGLVVAVGVTAAVAFFWARRRGLRIYTAAVREIDPFLGF
jgi:hypothetical protein